MGHLLRHYLSIILFCQIMSKQNAPCPCGSQKKYKKCCKSKGLYTKKSEVPSMWKNLGESHPSFRFSIGDRIEAKSMKEMYAKWIPGTVRGFIVAGGGYDILLDYPDSGMSLDCELPDKNRFVRPLGKGNFNRSSSFIKLCRKRMPHALVDLKRNTKSVAKLKVCTPKNHIFLQLGKTWVKVILRFVFQLGIVLKQI